MAKPKITYLHQYFVPPQAHGGTRSYEFARRLIAAGYDVTLITSTFGLPEEYKTLEKTQTIDIDGITIVAIPQPYSNKMSFSQRIMAFVSFAVKASWQTIKHPTDVIFATSTPLTIVIPGLIGKIWHRKPMVFEVRDLWPELPIAVGALNNPVFRTLARMLEWVAYHSSNHIIALSPGMAEGVKRRNIADDRVTVIPNSSDIKLFAVPPEQGSWVRDKLNLKPTQPLIVYTGTFGLINGVEYLAKVAHELYKINPEIHILLIGDGKQKSLIEETAKSLDVLGKNLTMWEPLPKVELVQVLATATVATSLFLPIKEMENNSANKFFDGLAAGKPIAINYGGWQKDILEDSGAGICLPYDDVEAAAHQLANFVIDEQQLLAAGQASRKLAESQFSRDLLFAKFEQVIRDVNSAS